MRWDFRSESCFSSGLGYPGPAVVGELCSDGGKWHWLLLFMFLNLPLHIWLSLLYNWTCYLSLKPVPPVSLVIWTSWESSCLCEPCCDRPPESQTVSGYGRGSVAPALPWAESYRLEEGWCVPSGPSEGLSQTRCWGRGVSHLQAWLWWISWELSCL